MYMFFINVAVILGLVIVCPVSAFGLQKNKRLNRYLLLVFSYLCILALMRSFSVGTDTASYCRQFLIASQTKSLSACFHRIPLEKGYLTMLYLLSRISSSPRILLVVSGLVMFVSMGRFLMKYSKMPWMSTFLFFTLMLYDFFLSGLRQALAISILLFAYDCVLEKKPIRFILLVLLASQFHLSACIFFIVYPISKIKSNRNYVISILAIGAGLTVFWEFLLPLLLQIFPKYRYYLGDSEFSSGGRLAVLLKLAVYLTILAAGQLLKEKEDAAPRTPAETMEYRIVWILGIVCCAAVSAAGVSRFLRYFEPFICLYLPNTLMMRKTEENRKYGTALCVALFFCYDLVIQLLRTPEWQQTYPFLFFWQ